MNLKQIIKEEYKLYTEGKSEDLVEKFPELQPAYEAGIRNPSYLQWIQKRRAGEPVEDIIDIVKRFDELKPRLAKKDIYAYKNPSELRIAIENLGASKRTQKRAEKQRLTAEETTILGTFGDWIVAMPHTVESSCQLGKGTTWCTAATQSQNLFLSYVARGYEDIILYYIMKKGANPRKDPTAKLSVGFVNGEPVLDGEKGGITVDAANNGITKEALTRILGDQFGPIMSAMKENASSVSGKHPAKKQLEKIAKSKDPSVIDKYTQGMEEDEKLDFIELIIDKEPSSQVWIKLSEDEVVDIRKTVANNPSTPPEVLVKLSGDKEYLVREEVAANPSTPPEVLVKLSEEEKAGVLRAVAYNPSTPPEVLVKLSGDKSPSVRRRVANNRSTPPEALAKLSGDELYDILIKVSKNPKTPPEALAKLASTPQPDYTESQFNEVRIEVSKNPNTPPEALTRLASDSDSVVRQNVASNPSTAPELLTKLVFDEEAKKSYARDNNIIHRVLENPNTPPEVLVKFSKSVYDTPRLAVGSNPSTPPEVLVELSEDEDARVREEVAANPSTPPEVLVKLSEDEHARVRKQVANNPSTPLEVLVKLSGDEVEYVRRAAKYRQNYKKPKRSKSGLFYLQETNRKTKMINDNLKQIIKEEYRLVINERKEMITYHLKNKVPFSDNVYRVGSENYFKVIGEARRLYNKGRLQPLNEADRDLFENFDLGEWAEFEGERVPLDFPMWSTTIEEAKKKKKKDPPLNKPTKNTGAGKKYKVYVRSKSGGIKKISYGDAKGGLKGNWNSAEARSSFAKRHKCAQKKDKTKAGYWACRAHKDFGTNVPGRFW
jgi:hypothetical protein